MYDIFVRTQPSQCKSPDIPGNTSILVQVRVVVVAKGQALGYQMVLYKRESACREEVDGDVPVADISSTTGKSIVGEAFGGNMGEPRGENSVLWLRERRRSLVLI